MVTQFAVVVVVVIVVAATVGDEETGLAARHRLPYVPRARNAVEAEMIAY